MTEAQRIAHVIDCHVFNRTGEIILHTSDMDSVTFTMFHGDKEPQEITEREIVEQGADRIAEHLIDLWSLTYRV